MHCLHYLYNLSDLYLKKKTRRYSSFSIGDQILGGKDKGLNGFAKRVNEVLNFAGFFLLYAGLIK